MKRLLATALTVVLLFAVTAWARTDAALSAGAEVPTVETAVTAIQKYGNLELALSTGALLNLGYEYGDVVTVTVGGQALDMPLGSGYSDVDSGEMILRAAGDGGGGVITVAINMGDLATACGIAVKTAVEEAPGYRWDLLVEEPVTVAIALKEKGGYADEYLLRQLVRTAQREDYPHLTDEEYANFRGIGTAGMGIGALYRSSSPLNPELGRSRQADEALNNAGVQTVMNLCDTEEAMRGFEDYPTSYYSQRDVIALNMGVDFAAPDFREKLAQGLAFFATHEGPYLVHCKEGKDRCGFVCAILECLMGAPADEVAADYMVTYYNYYGVEPGSEQYEAIVNSNIRKSLERAFGVENLWEADLAACAEEYLRALGLSDETIASLRHNLSRPWGQE